MKEIENLTNNQIMAINVLSYVYYHNDPMSLISTRLNESGVATLALWINLDTGLVVCNKNYNPFLKVKKGLVKLPDTVIPLRAMASNLNLKCKNSRGDFLINILKFIVVEFWTINNLEVEKALNCHLVSRLKRNLSEPIFTASGAKTPIAVYEGIIKPIIDTELNKSNTHH